MVKWWRWTASDAESHFQVWLLTDALARAAMRVLRAVPKYWEIIEDWFVPRALRVAPSHVKDNVVEEKTCGINTRVAGILFHVLKQAILTSRTASSSSS